jgi:hypothetical protein
VYGRQGKLRTKKCAVGNYALYNAGSYVKLVKEKIVNFCRTHEQIKLVKEELSRKTRVRRTHKQVYL